MFEPKVFREQMYCVEECTCDTVGTFLHQGHCDPIASCSYAPEWKISIKEYKLYFRRSQGANTFLGDVSKLFQFILVVSHGYWL